MTDRTFDYVPRLDERNKLYRVAAPGDLMSQSRYWTPGAYVTDQGREGACCGHGVVNEAMASPVRVIPNGKWATSAYRGAEASAVAQQVYERCKEIDEWEGVDYDGTSVRAGMLVGRERGWWRSFRWAFNMSELRAALEEGPIVIGVDWYDSMYQPVGRDLVVRGKVVGGHCILVTGYQAATKSYRLRNSWGGDWAQNGNAYIADVDLNRILFQAGGEAAVALNRALG